MPFWLTIALQAAQAPLVASAFDLANVGKAQSSGISPLPINRCADTVAGDDIVVCGAKRRSYRLPLPDERDVVQDRPRGEALTGTDAIRPAGRCGIFEGERHCDKKEAAEYGYGNGRDPITVLTRIIGKTINPGAN